MRLMKILAKIANEPFRLFFPLGVFYALIAVVYWPLSVTHLAFQNIPIEFHVWLQIYGFLWAFILGFLGTAVPRLTKAGALPIGLVSTIAVLQATIAGCLYFEKEAWAHAFFALSILLFASALVTRFWRRQNNLPPSFVFLPFGLFSGLVGSSLMAVIQLGFDWHFDILYTLARLLLTQAFVLFLILGVGGFLIRSWLGHAPPLPVGENGKPIMVMSASNSRQLILLAMASLIILTYILEASLWPHPAQVLRAAICTLLACHLMKIHRPPADKKPGARLLILGVWLILAGLWGRALSPEIYRLAFLHLTLIGGFSLITITVATRVVLSHSGNGPLLAKPIKGLNWAAGFILFGMIARFGADFTPDAFAHHLLYGGLSWVMGLSLWTWFVLRYAIIDTFK
jgi:uncharacterized protein involved in response to NO